MSARGTAGGPGPLAAALADALGTAVARLERIPGGDLNEAYAATLADGARVFVKTSADAAPGAYAAEAEGLAWLAEPAALPLPRVRAVRDTPAGPAPGAPVSPAAAGPPTDAAPPAGRVRFLALDWIEPGRSTPAAEEALGRGLAGLHAAGAPAFGGPSERCFAAYEEVAPLAPGAAERVALWQLAPLLLHAVLFGGGYGARAAAILRRYA